MIMARTGENIYKRKDGRWEARFVYRIDAEGKAKYRSVYGISRQDAKQKRTLLAYEFMLGSEVKTSPVITFTELTKNWLNSVKLRVKESTYSRYYCQVYKHILPYFGKYRVSQVSTEFIENYITYLLKARIDGGHGLSPKTVEDILIIVKSMLGFGKCCSHLELNRIKIKTEDKRPGILTMADKKTLNEYLLTDTDNVKAGVLLSMYLGVRLGEVCALRWKSFDLESGTVHIEKTMQRIQLSAEEAVARGKKTKIIITVPKSKKSIRDLDIPSSLTTILRKIKGYPDDFFLTGNVCGMEPRSLHNRFKGFLKQCDISNYNYHSLRHTFATDYIAAGYDAKSLSEILGHGNVKITLERYVHASCEQKRNNIENLVKILSSYSPSELSSK